jgi:hypothetical protein
VVQNCNANLKISGIQSQQQDFVQKNNETQRILLDQQKIAMEELNKEKAKTEQLTSALTVAATNISDPKASFDVMQFAKKIRNDGTVAQPPYQAPQNGLYQHQQPVQAYQQQGQYQQPQVNYNPNVDMHDNVAANMSPFFTQAPHINYQVAEQTASRIIKEEPIFNEFKAVPEFAARNPDAFKRIRNMEGARVSALQYE